MFSHVGFTSLPVQDLARAIAFWRDTMGFAVAADTVDATGARWVTMQIPGATTLIHLNPHVAIPVSQVPALTLVAPDVATVATNLAALGVVFSQPTVAAPWDASIQMATFHDSEGNLIMMTTR